MSTIIFQLCYHRKCLTMMLTMMLIWQLQSKIQASMLHPQFHGKIGRILVRCILKNTRIPTQPTQPLDIWAWISSLLPNSQNAVPILKHSFEFINMLSYHQHWIACVKTKASHSSAKFNVGNMVWLFFIATIN